MSGIEGNSQGVRGTGAASPLPIGPEPQAGTFGIALTAALHPAARRGPEELARLLSELGRLSGNLQGAILTIAAKGRPGNPAEVVRELIAETFPIGSPRRHRLGEALALHQGRDPSRMSRTAIEGLVTEALAKIGLPRPAPRPIQDVLEPSPDYGPFVTNAEAVAATASPVDPAASASAPLPPPVAPFFEPAAATTPAPVEEPPAAVPPPPPPPVYYAPPPSGGKKKKGLFGKILGFFKKALGIDLVKKVWNKVKRWVKELLPYIAMILRFIPLGWTQILAAVIQIYLAVKAKNIMGIVAAVASFIPAVGAAVGSTALSAAAQVATKVAEIARYAQQAMDAVKAIRRGDWIGGLAGLASGAAGVVGNFSEGAASALRGWSADLGVWGQRLQSGVQAIAAARRGDFLGAFGVGANLAADLDLFKGEGAFKQVVDVVSRVGTAQSAIRSGDWATAAGVVSGLAGEYGGHELKAVASTVEELVTVQRLVKGRDYLGAATIVLRVAGQFPTSAETREDLHEMAGRLQAAGRAIAQGRAGDFTGAAKNLWQLGLSAQWDKETRESIQTASRAFGRAMGVVDALKSGDIAKASALLAEVVALLGGEKATPEVLKQIARRLQDSGGLAEAVRRGDHQKAADILGEILERETTGDSATGGGGSGAGGGSGDDAESGGKSASALRVALGPESGEAAPPRRSLEASLEETIRLLNVWTRTPEERSILEILREVPDSELNAFLAELKVRGYLEKLFNDLHGEEYQELIRVLASKGARAPLDESAAGQIVQGILGGGAQVGRDLVDGVMALFKLETYVGMAETSRLLVLAADPGGILRLVAPQVRNEAIEKLKRIYASARDKVIADWEAAKAQGKEAEIIARWSTQGILEVATLFVGAGEVKKVVDVARLSPRIAGAAAAPRLSRLVVEAGGWKNASDVWVAARIEGAEPAIEALKAFERTGDEQVLRFLKAEQLDAMARALEAHVAARVGPGNLPYVIRYDPLHAGKPDPRWSIDTSGFKSGERTANGGLRNAPEFWSRWLALHPETISASNRYRIETLGRSPVVDAQWVRHFPEHAFALELPAEKRLLVHHHVDQGPVAVPVPDPTHVGSGGPWHGRPTSNYYDQ